MSNVVLYGIMIVAFIAMLWANHQFTSKGVDWGRPLAGLCGIIAVGMALFALYTQYFGNPTKDIIERERAYTRVGYQRLGEHLGSLHEGKKLIVIVQEYDMGASQVEGPTQNEIIMQALNAGINNRMDVKVVNLAEGVDMNDPEAMDMMPMDGMLTGADFEKILAENVPGYTLIVDEKEQDPITEGNPRDYVVLSIVGLPMDVEPLSFWSKDAEERPILSLSNATLNEMLERFTSGHIDSVLSYNPNATFDPEAKFPKNESEAFDQRFILITQYNFEEIATAHPDIFGLEAAPPAEEKK